MLQKIVQIGNSIGVIIPKDLAQETRLTVGADVFVAKDPNGTSIIINKDAKVFNSSITPDFLRIVSSINSKYRSALEKLAKK